tara:strand:+ start:269 stop:550 length:282 start_codon:yes stop_codon:yes gene_type:complete
VPSQVPALDELQRLPDNSLKDVSVNVLKVCVRVNMIAPHTMRLSFIVTASVYSQVLDLKAQLKLRGLSCSAKARKADLVQLLIDNLKVCALRP